MDKKKLKQLLTEALTEVREMLIDVNEIKEMMSANISK